MKLRFIVACFILFAFIPYSYAQNNAPSGTILERLQKLEQENIEIKRQIAKALDAMAEMQKQIAKSLDQNQLLLQQNQALLQHIQRFQAAPNFPSPWDILKHNPNATSGLYWIEVRGVKFQAYVDLDKTHDGGCWVMLYNSVGNPVGPSAMGDQNTLAFWKIAYLERFNIKGEPFLYHNYYNGLLYLVGPSEYRDEVEDLKGKSAIMFKATSEGIDPQSMRMKDPKLVDGNNGIFSEQFGNGWSSFDFDGDPYESNCAVSYANVTQHYSNCWYYNLGSDADNPYEDNAWGPHLNSGTANQLGIFAEPGYSRVNRITRWIRWNK